MVMGVYVGIGRQLIAAMTSIINLPVDMNAPFHLQR